jgi:hypothetical protein
MLAAPPARGLNVPKWQWRCASELRYRDLQARAGIRQRRCPSAQTIYSGDANHLGGGAVEARVTSSIGAM